MIPSLRWFAFSNWVISAPGLVIFPPVCPTVFVTTSCWSYPLGFLPHLNELSLSVLCGISGDFGVNFTHDEVTVVTRSRRSENSEIFWCWWNVISYIETDIFYSFVGSLQYKFKFNFYSATLSNGRTERRSDIIEHLSTNFWLWLAHVFVFASLYSAACAACLSQNWINAAHWAKMLFCWVKEWTCFKVVLVDYKSYDCS